MMRILIAGATGYLGRYLVAEYKRRGCWVRVLVRRHEQAQALAAADDVFVGPVTDPAAMTGVADAVDTVFSAIGITKPSDRFGYDDVDYGGNLTLLREAERSGVERFGYVALFNGPRLRDSARMVAAKERFVDALTAADIGATIIRPTGFFSDMRAFVDMAARGRSLLIGDGTHRINPISGRDLAAACADAIETRTATLDIGGPQVYTHEDIARLATRVSAANWRVTHVPPWLLRGMVTALRTLTPQRIWGPLEFFSAVMTTDMVAPTAGSEDLEVFLSRYVADRARAAQGSIR